MGNQICVIVPDDYLPRAKRAGLNVSKVCREAILAAITKSEIATPSDLQSAVICGMEALHEKPEE